MKKLMLLLMFIVPQALSQPATFVSVRDTQFVVGDCPFSYVGTSCYYLLDIQALEWSEVPGPEQVNQVLDLAQVHCLNVIRTHAFLDGEAWPGQPGLQIEPNVYNSTYLIALDSVIYKAGLRNIKLIMPLVNYWEDYGGMLQYVDWYNERYNPDLPRTQQQFYINDTLKSWYKNYIHDIVTRENSITHILYKDDPTILAWQLGNEPRPTPQSDTTNLFAWIDEMASYLRAQDPNHLIGIGAEGNYWSNMDTSFFRSLHNRTTIDFSGQHLYPDCYHMCIPTLPEVLTLIHERIRLSHSSLNKPILFDEYGLPRDYVDGSGYGRQDYFIAMLDQINSDNGTGSNFWLLYPNDRNQWLEWDWDSLGVFEVEDSVLLDSIANRACYLEAPTVTIHRVGDEIQLNWCAIPVATCYEVQESNTPDGQFLTVATPCSTAWTTALSTNKKFYRILATR